MLCVCARMHLCVHVCAHVYVYVLACVCLHVHVYACVHMCACMRACVSQSFPELCTLPLSCMCSFSKVTSPEDICDIVSPECEFRQFYWGFPWGQVD